MQPHAEWRLRWGPWLLGHCLLSLPAIADAACNDRWIPPPHGTYATDLNGVQLPDVCIPKKKPPHNVFIIGDWGGTLDGPSGTPITADHRAFGRQKRIFLDGIDDRAQQNVRDQMRKLAPEMDPDYVINVGDHFYWGGLEDSCGNDVQKILDKKNWSFQWGPVYEKMYTGKGLDGKQWLGVLGNHDYGGFLFVNAWDQAIARTWADLPGFTNRWILPAQYWRSKVHYPDFSVDYYFLDSNIFSTWDPFQKVAHNICGIAHNPIPASCGPMGPVDVDTCHQWFQSLWDYQGGWLRMALYDSTADWQIVVTHYPPCYGQEFWEEVTSKYGIDLIITGHKHMQEIYQQFEIRNFINGTGWVVSGGGGGITSEGMPSRKGHDDQYGFMTMTLSKEAIEVKSISHGGFETLRGTFHKRDCKECRPKKEHPRSKHKTGFTLCGTGKCIGEHKKHLINKKYDWVNTTIDRDGSATVCHMQCAKDSHCIGYHVQEIFAHKTLHTHNYEYSTRCRILRDQIDVEGDVVGEITGVDTQSNYFCWAKGHCKVEDLDLAALKKQEAEAVQAALDAAKVAKAAKEAAEKAKAEKAKEEKEKAEKAAKAAALTTTLEPAEENATNSSPSKDGDVVTDGEHSAASHKHAVVVSAPVHVKDKESSSSPTVLIAAGAATAGVAAVGATAYGVYRFTRGPSAYQPGPV